MVLYLIASVPLFYGFVVSLLIYPASYGRDLWFWYFRGILVFIPAYIIFLLIRHVVPLGFTPFGIWVYHFLYDDLLFALLAAAGFYLVRTYLVSYRSHDLLDVLSFLSGLYTFVSIAEFVRNFAALDLYLLLLLPTTRLALILVLTLTIGRAIESNGLERSLNIAGALVFTAACAVVPLLFTMHFGWAAILSAIVLAAGGGGYFIMERDSV